MKNIDTQNTKSTKEANRSSLTIPKVIWLFILVIVMAVLGVLGKESGKYFTKILFNTENETSKQIKLKRYSLGSTDLSILSPGPLEKRPITIPDDIQKKIKNFNNFDLKDWDKYKIAISCTEAEYFETIVDVSGAVDNMILNLSNLNGVENMTHSRKDLTLSGCKGVAFYADYVQRKAPIRAKGIILSREKKCGK